MTTPASTARRPEPSPLPSCALPAVDGWSVYDYADGGPRYVKSFPYCRFHEQTQHAAAKRAAAVVGPRASVYPANYEDGQSRVACTGERNPAQLGEALDRERIDQAAENVRAALRRLTSLTTNAFGHSFEIGNEGAVLRALQELVDDVEEEVGTVARRMASRTTWSRVAALGSMTRLDRPVTARGAWQQWGGGPGDEVPPEDQASA